MTDFNNVPVRSQYSYEDIDHLIQTADLPQVPTDVDTLNMLNDVESKLSKTYIPKVETLSLPTGTQSGFSNDDTSNSKPNLQTTDGINNYLSGLQNNKVDNPLVPYRHSSYNTNFERYYYHPAISRLGFNPFIDNETRYNENATWWEDTRRAAGQFGKLMGTGLVSAYRSLGDMFDDDSYLAGKDLESAREFADATRIGNTNRGGIGGFITNTGLQLGYSAGVVLSIALEELALSSLTGGFSALGAPAKIAARIAKSSVNATIPGKITKGTMGLLNNLKNINNYKGFRNSVKLGDNFVTRFVAPETVEVLKTLSTSKNAAKNMSSLAKLSKTVGAGYRDFRSLNYALSEAKMEAGMLYDQQYADNIAKLQEKSFDGNLSMEDIMKAKNNANGAAFYGLASNAFIIHASNQFVLGTALSSHSRRLKKILEEPSGGLFNKLNVQKPLFKDGKFQQDVFAVKKEGIGAALDEIKKEGVKSIGKGIKKSAEFALRYTVANIAEGLQEVAQEAVAEGAKEYYNTVFDDPMLGGVNLYLATLGSGMGKQLTGQGFETFMSGFVMGGPMVLVQKVLFDKVPNFAQRVFNNKEYTAYQARKEEAMNTLTEISNQFWNQLATNENGSLIKNIENLLVQKQISEEMADAVINDDLMQVYNLKDFSKLMNVYTLIENNGLDYFRDLIQDTLQMNSEELAEAFPSSKTDVKNDKIRERLTSYLSDIDKIENQYNVIDNKYLNPYDETIFPVESDEYREAKLKKYLYERYKMVAMFATDRVRRSAERMLSIYDDLEQKPLYQNMAASDIVLLLSPEKISTEISLLKSELEGLDENTNYDLYAKTKQKLEDLTAIDNFYNEKRVDLQSLLEKEYENYKDEYSTIDEFLESEEAAKIKDVNKYMSNSYKNRKSKKAFKNEIDFRHKSKLADLFKTYLDNLAGAQDDVVDKSDLYEVLRKIFDYSALQKENFIFNNAAVVMADPDVLSKYIDRSAKYQRATAGKQKEQFEKSIENYVKDKELSAFLMQVADLKDKDNKSFGLYVNKQNFALYLATEDMQFLKFENQYGIITPQTNPELYNIIEGMKKNFSALTKKKEKEEKKKAREEFGEEFDEDFDDDFFDDDFYDETDDDYDDPFGISQLNKFEAEDQDTVNFNFNEVPFIKESLELNSGDQSIESFLETDEGQNLLKLLTTLIIGTEENIGIYTYKEHYNNLKRTGFKLKTYGSVQTVNNYFENIAKKTDSKFRDTREYIYENYGIDDVRQLKLDTTSTQKTTSKKTKKKVTKKKKTKEKGVTTYKGFDIEENFVNKKKSFFTVDSEDFEDVKYNTLKEAKNAIEKYIKDTKYLQPFKFGENEFQYGQEIRLKKNNGIIDYVIVSGGDIAPSKMKKIFVIPKSEFKKGNSVQENREQVKNEDKILPKTLESILVSVGDGKSTVINVNKKTGKVTTSKDKNVPLVKRDALVDIYPHSKYKNEYNEILSLLTDEEIEDLDIEIIQLDGAGELTNKKYSIFEGKKRIVNENVLRKKGPYQAGLKLNAEQIKRINDYFGKELFTEENNILAFIPFNTYVFVNTKKEEIEVPDLTVSDIKTLIYGGDKQSLDYYQFNYQFSLDLVEKIKTLTKKGATTFKFKDLGLEVKKSKAYTVGKYNNTAKPVDTDAYNYDGHPIVMFSTGRGEIDIKQTSNTSLQQIDIPDDLLQEMKKEQGYIYIYKLPSGEISYFGLKPKKTTEKEKDELYSKLAKRIIETRKENIDKDGKQKSNTFNTGFNKQINDDFFISGPKETFFEIKVSNTGSLALSFQYTTTDGKGKTKLETEEVYLENLIQDFYANKKENKEILSTEEIFDETRLEEFIKVYFNEALKQIKKLEKKSINIRKSIPKDAKVEDVIANAVTTFNENYKPSFKLKIQPTDRKSIENKIQNKKIVKQGPVKKGKDFKFYPEFEEQIAKGEKNQSLRQFDFEDHVIEINGVKYNVIQREGGEQLIHQLEENDSSKSDEVISAIISNLGLPTKIKERYKYPFTHKGQTYYAPFVYIIDFLEGKKPLYVYDIYPVEEPAELTTREEILEEYVTAGPDVYSKKLKGSEIKYTVLKDSVAEVYGVDLETVDGYSYFYYYNTVNKKYNIIESITGLDIVVDQKLTSQKEVKNYFKLFKESEQIKQIPLLVDSTSTPLKYMNFLLSQLEKPKPKPKVKKVKKKKQEQKQGELVSSLEGKTGEELHKQIILISNAVSKQTKNIKDKKQVLNLWQNVKDTIDYLSVDRDFNKYIRNNRTSKVNEAYKQLKSSRSKLKDIINKGGIAFKVDTVEESAYSEISMDMFRDWVSENLPDVFSVKELDTLIDNSTINGVRIGAFLGFMNTLSGKVEGEIYTSNPNARKFHEAFHGVFRLLLTNEEQNALLNIAESEVRKKYGANFLNELDKFRNKSSKYQLLSDKELKREFYEEYIADLFDDYTTGKIKGESNNIFVRFFKWLINKIKSIAGYGLKSDFKSLFEKINSGYFKSSNTVNNIFTDSLVNGVTTNANSIIRHSDFNDEGNIVNEYLDPITADNMVNRIVASVIEKQRNIDSNYNEDTKEYLYLSDLIEMSIDEFSEFYENFSNEAFDSLEFDQKLTLNQILSSLQTFNEDYVKAVEEKIRLLDLADAELVQTLVDVEEQGLIRNVESYDKDANMIGGFKALPSELRKYIGSTLVEDVDMFGNYEMDVLDPNKNEELINRAILTTVDTASVYNAFMKAVANTMDPTDILRKLIRFSYYNSNTRAVVNRILNDLNVQQDDVLDPTFDINTIKNKQLFLFFIKSFENYRVPYYIVHRNADTGKTYMYSTSNRDDANTQIDRWANKHRSLYPKLRSSIKHRKNAINLMETLKSFVLAEGDYADPKGKFIKVFNNEYAFIFPEGKDTRQIEKEFGSMQTDSVEKPYEEFSKMLNDSIGISLSPLYIEFSRLKQMSGELTPEQEKFVESYMYDIDGIEREDITQISTSIINYNNAESYLFKNRDDGTDAENDVQSRLQRLALENAEFDETVGAGSFINADGEMVYNHQLGTFMLKSLINLNVNQNQSLEDIINKLTEKHPILSFNYLLSDPYFQKLMEQGRIGSIRINGGKDSFITEDVDKLNDLAGTGDGTTYGSFTGQQFLTTLINSYLGLINFGSNKVETVTVGEEEKALAPVLIRVLEAANTGDMVPLPVIKSVMQKEGETIITQEAINAILMRLVGEVNRIQKEASGNGLYNNETKKGVLIKGYNATPAKDGSLIYTDTLKAFKLFNAGKILVPEKEFVQKEKYTLVQVDSIAKRLEALKDNDKSFVFFKSGSAQTKKLQIKNIPYQVVIQNKDGSIKSEKTIKLLTTYNNQQLIETEGWEEFMQQIIDSKYVSKTKDKLNNKPVEIKGEVYYTGNVSLKNFIDAEKSVTLDIFSVLNKKQTEEIQRLKNLVSEGSDVKSDLEELASAPTDTPVETIDDLKNLLAKKDIDFADFELFIRNNLKQQFINMFNVLQNYNMLNKLSKDFTEMTPFMGENYDAIQESQELLNLKDGNLEYNLMQVFINDYINTAAINDILLGDQAISLKDAVDMIKRAKGANGAIISVYNEMTDPDRGINHPVKEIDTLTLSDPLRVSKVSGEDIENADGTMYFTLKTHKYTQNALGRYSKRQQAAVEKLERGEFIDNEDIYGKNGLAKNNEMLNPKKFVYYNGEEYLKMSVVILTKELTSRLVNGKWVPKTGREKLHNLRVQLESIEVDENGNETGRFGSAAFVSASKMKKKNISSLQSVLTGQQLVDDAWTKLDARFFGLQVENPSNKEEIPDVTQIKNLITQEIPQEEAEKINVLIDGQSYNLQEIKEQYFSNKNEGYETAYKNNKALLFELSAAESFNVLDDEKARQKRTGSRLLKPRLKVLLDYMVESLKASNSSANIISYFEQDGNTEKYNLNNPIVEKKFIQLFLTFLSKNVFSEKLNGDKMTLISDFGINQVRLVFTADENGFPDKQIAIREEEFFNSGNVITLSIEDDVEGSGQDEAITSRLKDALEANGGKPIYIVDRLRHDLNEYEVVSENPTVDDFIPTGDKYSEIITPPRSLEVANRLYRNLNPDNIQSIFDKWVREERYMLVDDQFTSHQKKLLRMSDTDRNLQSKLLKQVFADTIGFAYDSKTDQFSLPNVKQAIKKLNDAIVKDKVKIKKYKSKIATYLKQQNNVKNNREFEELSRKIELADIDLEMAKERINNNNSKIKNIKKNPHNRNLKIPKVLQKVFSVRVPSQDKHSALNSKRVDFLPPIYGSSAVTSSELVEVSGWDFDIDSIFAHFKEYYIEGGIFKEYKKVEERTKVDGKTVVKINYKEEYKQYVRYMNHMMSKPKSPISKAFKLFKNGDIEIKDEIVFLDKPIEWGGYTKNLAYSLKRTGMFRNTATALSVLGMPRTLEEYKLYRDFKGNVPYKAALENQNLDLKFAMLGSKLFTEKRKLYKNKKGKLNFYGEGDLTDEARAVGYEPADLEPLQKLFEEFKTLLPEWYASKEETDIDVDNLLGKFISFYNNKLGAKNIGAIVLPNVYLGVLGQLGITINDNSQTVIDINGVKFKKFGEAYEILNADQLSAPLRSQYIISSLITAMTDNAKERMAAKLGLNKNVLAVVGTMLSMGVPLKTSMLLANNRVIQHLYSLKEANPRFSFEKSLSEVIATSTAFLKENAKKEKKVILGRRRLNDEELINSINEKVIDPFTEFVNDDFEVGFYERLQDKYENNFAEIEDLLRFEIAILQEYQKANKVQQFTRNVGTLIQLQNGLGNSVEDLLNYQDAVNKLYLDLPDKEFRKRLAYQIKEKKPSDIIVDVRDVFLTKDKNKTFHNMLFRMYNDVINNVLPATVLQFTNPFQDIVQTTFANMSPYIKNEDKVKVMEDLSSFITIKAYRNFLLNSKNMSEKITLDSLTNDLKYNDTKNIIKIVDNLRSIEKFKGNFFLNNFIIPKTKQSQDNNSGMYLVESNTFARLNDMQKLSLQSSLLQLLSDPDYKDQAMSIVHYVMVKDGLRFKYGGLASAIAPVAIEKYLFSIDGVMKSFTEDSNYLKVFGVEKEELLNEFITGYMQASKPANSLVGTSYIYPNSEVGSNNRMKTSKVSIRKLAGNNPNNIIITFNRPKAIKNISFNRSVLTKKYSGLAKKNKIKVGARKGVKFKHVIIFTKTQGITENTQKIIDNYESKNIKTHVVENLKDLKEFINSNNVDNLKVHFAGKPGTRYVDNLLLPLFESEVDYKTTRAKRLADVDAEESTQVFYLDTYFKDKIGKSVLENYAGYQEFISEQLDNIKQTLVDEGRLPSVTSSFDEVQGNLIFKYDTLSKGQLNFLNIEEDGTKLMQAISEVFKQENNFGYDPINNPNLGRSKPPKNIGAYVDNAGEVTKFIVNPYGVNLDSRIPFSGIPSKRIDDVTAERISDTKKKGFKLSDKKVQLRKAGGLEFLEFEFPLYKLVVLKREDEFGQEYNERKLFRLNVDDTKDENLIVKTLSSPRLKRNQISSTNKVATGYYAEYIEVPMLGSYKDTPIAFVNDAVPTKEEVYEVDDYETYGYGDEDFNELSDEFDWGEDDFTEEEDDYILDEGDDVASSNILGDAEDILSDDLLESQDEKKLRSIIDLNMFSIIENYDEFRYNFDIPEGEILNKENLYDIIVKYQEDNELSLNDIIEIIEQCKL